MLVLWLQFFHTTKIITSDFYETVVSKNVYLLHHGTTFYPLLVSFHLQVNYRKVRNLQIGVNKLVEKVSINFYYVTQSHAKSVSLHNQHNYLCTCWSLLMLLCTPKQIDLTSIFATTATLLCQCVIVNKRM